MRESVKWTKRLLHLNHQGVFRLFQHSKWFVIDDSAFFVNTSPLMAHKWTLSQTISRDGCGLVMAHFLVHLICVLQKHKTKSTSCFALWLKKRNALILTSVSFTLQFKAMLGGKKLWHCGYRNDAVKLISLDSSIDYPYYYCDIQSQATLSRTPLYTSAHSCNYKISQSCCSSTEIVPKVHTLTKVIK